jgi:hypothetical protein
MSCCKFQAFVSNFVHAFCVLCSLLVFCVSCFVSAHFVHLVCSRIKESISHSRVMRCK